MVSADAVPIVHSYRTNELVRSCLMDENEMPKSGTFRIEDFFGLFGTINRPESYSASVPERYTKSNLTRTSSNAQTYRRSRSCLILCLGDRRSLIPGSGMHAQLSMDQIAAARQQSLQCRAGTGSSE
jgi:hypothetical protein